MTANLAVRALVLGFSTGLFCIGFCVPLLGPVLLSRSSSAGRPGSSVSETAASLGLFLAGRLGAYLLLGLAFGTLGHAFSQVWVFRERLLPGMYLVLGVLMVVYGLVQSFPGVGLCRYLSPRVSSRWYLLVLGFAAGFHLCPPSLLAATAATETGGPLAGMLLFVLFFIASSSYMLPLLFIGAVNRFASVRFAARVAAVCAGLWFGYLAVRSFVG